jgi:hypothetical protein
MRKHVRFILSILTCLVLAVSALLWALGMLDSLENYRSPLKDNPPQPGAQLGEPLARQVVLVIVDALRVDTAADAAVMPVLAGLRGQGAYATLHSQPPSFSDPGWTTIFTGASPAFNDAPPMNKDYADTWSWTQDNLFSAAHRVGLRTAVSGYYWFEMLIPQNDVDASFYTPHEDNAADRQVVDSALPWVQSDEYPFILIHIDQMDYAGHYEGGPRDPRWNAAASRADALLGEIASAMDLSQDVLIVLSDHGQIDMGGHGWNDPVTLMEPFVMTGAAVIPGAYGDLKLEDVAPTLALLLGTNIPASNQGKAQSGMLDLPSEYLASLMTAEKSQQDTLNEAILAAGTDEDNGKFWRGAIALICALLPALWLIIKKKKDVWIYLGGGILYLLVYNLRYAVLQGKPYSLSPVASAGALILDTIIGTVLALGAAWLLVGLLRGFFQQPPKQAAQSTLNLTLTVLYLLFLLPLFSFFLNGVVVGQTLPDFNSFFLGLFSLVQATFVSAVGLLLAGISALAAWLLQRRRVKPALHIP